jgi:hypothetical protein
MCWPAGSWPWRGSKEARALADPVIRHARHVLTSCFPDDVELVMTAVMIGVDPHKASHTAVAVDGAEQPLGTLRVRACAGQAGRLLAWAPTAPDAPTSTARSPRARPVARPSARSSAASATSSTPASGPTPQPGQRAREGSGGTALTPARPAHTPRRRLFGQATPGPGPTLRAPASDRSHEQMQEAPAQGLDTKRHRSAWTSASIPIRPWPSISRDPARRAALVLRAQRPVRRRM